MGENLARGNISGLKLARLVPRITHTMYANDLKVIGETRIAKVKAIKSILKKFEEVSGSEINLNKSKV